MNGLDAWAEKGIAGRGILVDYADYADRDGIKYDKTKAHQISVDVVKAILAETKTEVHIGDILFLRTGFVEGYLALDQSEREAMKMEQQWPGMIQSQTTAEWLWESQFAAVAADNPAFECGRKFFLIFFCSAVAVGY